MEVYQAKTNVNTTKFEDVLKKKGLTPSWKQTYKDRMSLFEFLSEQLFGVEIFKFVGFCFCFYGNEFLQKVENLRKEMVVEEIQLSCEDVIEVHFEAKGSYTQLSKFISVIK